MNISDQGTTAKQLKRFALMARMRKFDEACIDGVQSGEIHGEMHTSLGQEAIAAGIAESLKTGDALVSTHRNHSHGIAKGVQPLSMLAEIFERLTGLCRGRGGHMHLFDLDNGFSTTGIVGGSLAVALGHAYAFWMEDSDSVAVAVTGDGGANTGAFHECLNIAGAWNLPYVVLVENNKYAISVPFEFATATETIAERGNAYGAWHALVDGSDVDAVAKTFAKAVEHARLRNGPALVEATVHRFRGHYEGDHDLYRSKDYKESMQQHDPLARYRSRLLDVGAASEDELDRILAGADAEIAGLLRTVRNEALPDASEAHMYLFAEEMPV